MDKCGLSNENQASEDGSSALFHRLLCDSGSSWGVKREPSVSALFHSCLTQCLYSLTKTGISAGDRNEKFYFQPSLWFTLEWKVITPIVHLLPSGMFKWPQVTIRRFMCRFCLVKMVICYQSGDLASSNKIKCLGCWLLDKDDTRVINGVNIQYNMNCCHVTSHQASKARRPESRNRWFLRPFLAFQWTAFLKFLHFW